MYANFAKSPQTYQGELTSSLLVNVLLSRRIVMSAGLRFLQGTSTIGTTKACAATVIIESISLSGDEKVVAGLGVAKAGSLKRDTNNPAAAIVRQPYSSLSTTLRREG